MGSRSALPDSMALTLRTGSANGATRILRGWRRRTHDVTVHKGGGPRCAMQK